MKNKLRIWLILFCLCPSLMYGQNILSTLEDIHQVAKGETWESIAADKGISVVELQEANPDVGVNKLKKGTLLIIPRKPKHEPSEVQEKPLPVIRTAISNLKVGVLLPLSDKKMVEFYRGLLMAADSVRRSGVNLDIYAWDCGSTAAQVEPLLPKLDGMDVLFGPESATQIPAVAEVCRERGIRLVLPFLSGQTTLDYPLVYNATASNAVLYDAAVKKLMSYYGDKNYVIVRSNNADNTDKGFSERLVQTLAQRSVTPKVVDLEGDDFAYESAFNQFRDNMVLLDDGSVRSLNILLARLKTFRQKHPAYRLSLIGYPGWQDETQRLLDDFFAFDTYVISPYFYNVLDDKAKSFQRSYEKNFRKSIAQNTPRYAALGFDLGYYFMSGISSLGDTFEQMQGSLHQDPYQNWYKFERSAAGMSFSNNFVMFIHYTMENRIELIR